MRSKEFRSEPGRRRTIRRAGALALTLAALGIASREAAANAGGIFGRSGRTVGFTCSAAACHGAGPGGSTADFALAPLDPDYPPVSLGFVPGAAYTVTVSVFGGPGVVHGFNWEANVGTARATDANTQANTNEFHLAEMTNTLAGAGLATWSFEWTAPAERNAVGFWLSAVSGDGDATRAGDAPTPSQSTQIQPLPLEILARIGNVNAAAGDPVPILFVNDSRGDDARVLAVPTGAGSVFRALFAPYPGGGSSIPYVLYAIERVNGPGDVATVPGIGTSAFPFPPSGGAPIVVANTFGHFPRLGVPRLSGAPPGPGTILSRSDLPVRLAGTVLTLQGLVPDSTAPGGGAVTNAIVLAFQ